MSCFSHSVADTNDSGPWNIPVDLLDWGEEVALEIPFIHGWWIDPKSHETNHTDKVAEDVPWHSPSETRDTGIWSKLMNALL